MGNYLPDGFIHDLKRAGVPEVDDDRIWEEISKQKDSVAKDPHTRPFMTSAELRRRNGFPLPSDVVHLLTAADTFRLERARTKNFKYLRLTLQGWELPENTEYLPLAHAVFARFKGPSAFGNLQIWEHLGGLITIGTDNKDNRFFASTLSTSEDSVVFWMNHEAEKCGLNQVTARTLSSFLSYQFGNSSSPKKEALRNPLQYKNSFEDLLNWPPFLIARSEWMLQLIAFSRISNIEPAAFTSDFDMEKRFFPQSEPLVLYWLLRSFLMDDKDGFLEISGFSSISPLAESFNLTLSKEWNFADDMSRFTIARASLRNGSNSDMVLKLKPHSPRR
jgi:hypothetical protein